jgi:hypothetical protein
LAILPLPEWRAAILAAHVPGRPSSTIGISVLERIATPSLPDSVEFLLHALAGCVTTTTVLHAAARGIEIESLCNTVCRPVPVVVERVKR